MAKKQVHQTFSLPSFTPQLDALAGMSYRPSSILSWIPFLFKKNKNEVLSSPPMPETCKTRITYKIQKREVKDFLISQSPRTSLPLCVRPECLLFSPDDSHYNALLARHGLITVIDIYWAKFLVHILHFYDRFLDVPHCTLDDL